MSWYKILFGIEESGTVTTIQSNFIVDVDKGKLKSIANNKTFQIGHFSTPSLLDLREKGLKSLNNSHILEKIKLEFSFVHETQDDVLKEHAKYPGAVFQAASQFNCLEFSSSKSTPELGVTGYEWDNTQGPACALACAAGTVYRNYFVDVSALSATGKSAAPCSQLGQYTDCQINNLDALEVVLNNSSESYFNVLNGYTFSNGEESLARLTTVIENSKKSAAYPTYDDFLGLIKIGTHTDVGVTFRSRFSDIVGISEGLTVTQAYCSALSCAYSGISPKLWTSFAKLVLDATYEATLWTAVINAVRPEFQASKSEEFPLPSQQHKHDVFLSFIGGGVFGNNPVWISDAIGRSLAIMHIHKAPICVHIAHFRVINDQYVQLIDAAYKNYLKEFSSQNL